MVTFRFLHLSDLHLREQKLLESFPLPSARMQNGRMEILINGRSVANDVLRLHEIVRSKLHPQYVDLTIITGDMADKGDRRSIQIAFDHLCQSEKAIFPDSFQRVFVPGNHDRYRHTKFWDYNPGGESFDQIFHREWSGGHGGVHHRAIARICPKTGAREAIGVVCGDFSLQEKSDATTPFGILGQGKAYPEIINRMEETTRKLADQYSPIFIVWALHFPPHYPYGDRLDNRNGMMELIDSQQLIDSANRCQISHILCGHAHEQKMYTVDTVNILCTSTVLGESDNTGSRKGFQMLEFFIEGGKLENMKMIKFFFDNKNNIWRFTPPP